VTPETVALKLAALLSNCSVPWEPEKVSVSVAATEAPRSRAALLLIENDPVPDTAPRICKVPPVAMIEASLTTAPSLLPNPCTDPAPATCTAPATEAAVVPTSTAPPPVTEMVPPDSTSEPANISAPLWTFTVPVLLNVVLIVEVVADPLLVNVPALFTAAV